MNLILQLLQIRGKVHCLLVSVCARMNVYVRTLGWLQASYKQRQASSLVDVSCVFYSKI